MITQKGTNAFWQAVAAVKEYVDCNIYFLENTY